MKNKRLRSRENRISYLEERINAHERLRSMTEELDLERLSECQLNIYESYQDASIVKHLAQFKIERSIEQYRFTSIGLHHRIPKKEFNATDYYWGPYFSDIGRAIAFGEQNYIFNRLRNYVKGCKETISRHAPQFEAINLKIGEMRANGVVPDTIICPIEIFVDFVEHFISNMDWSSSDGSMLNIEDCNLRTIWSNSYARLRSFILLNSQAGIWYVKPDEETGKNITVAMGNSGEHGYMEYWVETLAYYKIEDTSAFTRINLST